MAKLQIGVLCLAGLLLTGCADGGGLPACPTVVFPAIEVFVRDASTGDPAADGAIVVRLVDIQEDEVFVPRAAGPYGGYYDHWRRAGTKVYEAGYYRTDTEVIVETRLYDVHDARLLWAGTSNTINPRDVNEVIEGIVETAGQDLRKRGLVP